MGSKSKQYFAMVKRALFQPAHTQAFEYYVGRIGLERKLLSAHWGHCQNILWVGCRRCFAKYSHCRRAR